MADLKIDHARATVWVKDVQNEIYLVENTLGDVRQICETFPGEDDTIVQMIEKTGNMLDDAWTATTKGFKDAWQRLEEGMDYLAKTGEKLEQEFANLQSKI